MKLSILVLSVCVAAAASAAPAKSSKKKTDSAGSATQKETATPVPTPSNDIAAADGGAAKEAPKSEVKTGAIVRGPNKVKRRAQTRPLTGEAFVAPSVASLGERWADSMTGEQIGAEADRKTWNPALTIGVVQPIRGLAIELEGSGAQFSAPVPGGKTEGFVGHAAGRVGYERGAFGGEIGALVGVANVKTPETESDGAP